MTDKAFVISVQDDIITVMPMGKEACATCGAECSKKSATFVVCNPNKLDVTAGSTVRLQAKKNMQIIQGLVSLMVPVLSAVAGYFLSSPICSLFGKTAGEGAKALGVLILFLISSGLVFFFTRRFPMPGTPEIVEIL